MSIPELAPRRTFGGIIAVWIVAAIAAVTIGVLAAPDERGGWVAVALGGCLVLAFVVQLAYGRSQRFTQRMAASILGALVVMGLIGLGFGLATLVPA